ncbi:MAG: TonB-dependent receptor, partial [Gemmatimonadota bacterium]|nr:TonB-dependent receptor [Gemmatimonadota bacterium]
MRRSRLSIMLVLALIAVPFVAASARAQGGTIRGRVADSTGAAIAQALVIADPGGFRATSRDNGEYVIARVPAGTYTLRARRLGYVTPTTQVVVSDGQAIEQNFVVTRTAVALAEVVIGSRARHTAAEELAVPVDVFTPEQIKSQGTTETSQILSQLAPSVNFPRQSVSDATEIVRPFTMRGLSPDHTLVLLNGKRRHHTALVHYYGAGEGAGSSGVDMNAIPSGGIDRLEILRDGAAAQYGSDAIAGVVNVVLKEGA